MIAHTHIPTDINIFTVTTVHTTMHNIKHMHIHMHMHMAIFTIIHTTIHTNNHVTIIMHTHTHATHIIIHKHVYAIARARITIHAIILTIATTYETTLTIEHAIAYENAYKYTHGNT